MSSIGNTGGGMQARTVDTAATAAANAADKAEASQAAAVSVKSDLQDASDVSNPAAAKNSSSIKEKAKTMADRSGKKGETEKTEDTKIEGVGDGEEQDLADKHSQDNPELDAGDLKQLKSQIPDDASPESILSTVTAKYSDPVLASGALDYLQSTTPADNPGLKEALTRAQNTLVSSNKQAMVGGKNIMFASREFSSVIKASPSSLRAIYNDVTSNMRSCNELFTSMTKNYSYDDMGKVSSFLLAGMSHELTCQGPSIEPAQLRVLMGEIKSLQALTSICTSFASNMSLLNTMASSSGTSLPKSVTPESLSKSFMNMVGDKMPSMSKMENMARDIAGHDTEAQSCVLNLFYKTLSEAPARLFPSMDTRQKIGTALTSTLDKINQDNPDYPKSKL